MNPSLIAVDSSVAIPLLSADHTAHQAVSAWHDGRPLALADHAVVETYSVLTRLPGGARVRPDDAARLIEERFERPIMLTSTQRTRLPRMLAERGVTGAAVYDAVIALTASHHSVPLATRDARARTTYDRIGADIIVVAST